MKIGAQILLWQGNMEAALKDISASELDGIETFAQPTLEQFGEKTNEFRSLLKQNNISLSGMYYIDDLILAENQPQVIKNSTKAIQFLRDVGGEFLIIHPQWLKIGDKVLNKEFLPSSTYNRLASIMNDIGKIALDYGVKAVFHPHVDTLVENRDELDKIMRLLNPDLVGLCFHAAHFIRNNSNAYQISKDYADRIIYVHVSDMKGINKIPEALDLARKEGRDLMEVMRELGVRPVNLGMGEIDQYMLIKPIIEAGFNGWIIIEGKDPESTSIEALKISSEYLKSMLKRVRSYF